MYTYLARQGWVLDTPPGPARVASLTAFLFMVIPPLMAFLEWAVPFEKLPTERVAPASGWSITAFGVTAFIVGWSVLCLVVGLVSLLVFEYATAGPALIGIGAITLAGTVIRVLLRG